MPGRTYNPLQIRGEFAPDGRYVVEEDCELYRFRTTAKQGDVLDEMIGLTLPDTGIRAAAMAHMRETWWNGPPRAQIFVPFGESCTLGAGEGRGGDTRSRGVPCHRCRTRADKDWAPPHADFHPKSENGVRKIPVRNEDTIRVHESYWDLYDDVASQGTVKNRVIAIAERADIDRRVTPHDLRDTFGTLLALKDFGPYKIRDLMGHANLDEALDYIKLAGQHVQHEFDKKW